VSRTHRIVPTALGLLASLAVFFANGELVCRVFGLVDRLNGFARQLFVATDDPHLPYLLRPGSHVYVRGTGVIVNEQGLRGPAISTLPAPGVHRVLALGDSATFGENLRVEEAFPALLERELTARSGERYEVLNGGVEGYNTEAELAFLRQRGLALAPETIVVGFNLNDFDYAPVLGPLGVLTLDQQARVPSHSLLNRSEFYLVLRWLVRWRPWAGDPLAAATGPPPAGQRFTDLDRYVSAVRKQYYHRPSDARWQVMVDSLVGLGAVAREHRLRLVIAILPDGDQIGVPDPDLEPQRKLAAICATAQSDCLDLYPAFAAAAGDSLYFDTMHPNAAGQRVVARALADHLLGGAGSGASAN
jgi:lysophospholipase L1-like esterase